jgi:putative restriction endonuclease
MGARRLGGEALAEPNLAASVARVRPADQIRRLISGLEAGGATVVSFSRPTLRPVTLRVRLSNGEARTFLLYCWNVRPGGGQRSPTERRVQMTSVPRPHLYSVRSNPPLLLGYHEETDVFAAWDASQHRQTRNPSAKGGSNSLYVPLATLHEAHSLGFASHEHVVAGDAHEVVVAFRPEAADNYLRVAPAIRATGARNLAAIAAATSGRSIGRAGLSQKRVSVLRSVRQIVRDVRFPGEVLTAYGDKCAFCELGAKLVDAAHIKSVRSEGPDHVTNGLAACPTHHRAFDRGFLVVGDDYSITVNAKKTDLLDATDVQKLRRTLRKRLALPKDSSLWPDVRFIRAHRRFFA